MATPKEKTAMVWPKTDWASFGAGGAEFPKVKELLKLGSRAGLVAPAAAHQ